MYKEKQQINFDDLISQLENKTINLSDIDLTSLSREDYEKIKKVLKDELKKELSDELKIELKKEIDNITLLEKNKEVKKEIPKEVKEENRTNNPVVSVTKKTESMSYSSSSSYSGDGTVTSGIMCMVVGLFLLLLPLLFDGLFSFDTPPETLNSSALGAITSDISSKISSKFSTMVSMISYIISTFFFVKGVLKLKQGMEA